MNGYLGRMLAAAGARASELHPFAGSIYENGPQSRAAKPASRRNPDAAADPEQHLLVEANDDAREADNRLRRPVISQRVPPDARNPAAPVADYVPLYRQRRDNRLPTASRLFAPVEEDLIAAQAPPVAVPSGEGRARSRPNSRGAGDPETGETARLVLPPAPTVTRVSSAAGGAPASAPIVASLTGRDADLISAVPRSGDNLPRDGARAVTAPLPPRATPPRQSESATREFVRSGGPDQSVEIHIGRVEVLAAAPSAARAPAASRSRTTSLADYLARRNGRGR